MKLIRKRYYNERESKVDIFTNNYWFLLNVPHSAWRILILEKGECNKNCLESSVNLSNFRQYQLSLNERRIKKSISDKMLNSWITTKEIVVESKQILYTVFFAKHCLGKRLTSHKYLFSGTMEYPTAEWTEIVKTVIETKENSKYTNEKAFYNTTGSNMYPRIEGFSVVYVLDEKTGTEKVGKLYYTAGVLITFYSLN